MTTQQPSQPGSEPQAAPDERDHPTPPLHPHEVFDRVGGMEAFTRLVDAFYRRVERDDVLRPMYPDDLEPGKRHLAMFFAQYWGGGDLYSRDRGHPRLRMRHAPFQVTPEAAARWARHMTDAVVEQSFDAQVTDLFLRYIQQATPTLINTFGEPDVAPGSALPQA